jgi:hypothetical protein
MSQPPKTAAGRLQFAAEMVKNGVLSIDEMLALLDGMTLEEYRLSKTKLGKLLAGKDE